MTLRGRLTTAFLVVVLGPVLLGSIFVAITVATVSRDRTAERLDHATTTVRTGMAAACRQLQAAADAVAVVPPDDRSAVASQLITRGLATDIKIVGQVTARAGGTTIPAPRPVEFTGWQDCAAPADGPATAIAARSMAGNELVTAAQNVDQAFLARLAAASGTEVSLTGGDRPSEEHRRLQAEPGQPLHLTLIVPPSKPTFLYALLPAVVLAVALAAVLVARWLAYSTTRPLGELAWAADRVADGDLDTRVPILRADELGRLAATFNRMTRELQAYVQALTASRDQLRGHLAILGETLSSTHDLHRILQVILRTALAATGARAGLVLLLDPATDQLVARCGVGLPGDWDVPDSELIKRRLPIGPGVLGAVAATGEPRRGQGSPASAEPPCLTYVAVPICAPAVAEEPGDPQPLPDTLGVLALYDRVGGDAFDDADLHTLRTFAGQAGVAVHNVRMHEEAQRLSLTDPLTGLWNYRYLRESLRREVERASRFGRMLAVLVLDLDHFKEVNDTYGHAAGDAVLGEFARRIRVGLREVDVAFRQGGEEFVVLLPETDAYGGAIVAERLGAAVRSRPVAVDGVQIPITVSIGVAVYPEHGENSVQVLAAADRALYAAKNAGRDTYRLAEPGDVTKSGVSSDDHEGNFDQTTAVPGGLRPQQHRRGR
ncbi:diguanylate cyclase [Paractinoplanes lichenicola]|uniref:Diguanylate cyclase n=1 Tax=Paractinoplanes lichenicola TaxID=2802976 RepID=A0ABS1VJ52_9ACTN|nr:diguanylate cyclase [Actinoplanes lichenicola]MBL7254737.1 diguanylate cyclase [Actinoplanes lichenicola]